MHLGLLGLRITRKHDWSSHNPHTMFLRMAERDGDETTGDSHFTVRGCKGNTRSPALNNMCDCSVVAVIDSYVLHCVLQSVAFRCDNKDTQHFCF